VSQPIQTQILPVVYQPDDSSYQQAIQIASKAIQAGQLVAFPTETVYGLGANALSAEAIARIYIAKQRPTSDPVIAHIAHIDQLQQLATNIPSIAYDLAEAFWAGALTMVLKRGENVPANIATGLETVAVRFPSHPIAHDLIKASGVPIAAPSANTFTRPSATTPEHVLEDLDGRIEFILAGGSTTIGLESTVIDLTASRPRILRPGGITVDEILRVIPDADYSPQFTAKETPTSAPGQMLKHYSPRAQVILYHGERNATLEAMYQTALEQIAQGKTVGLLITQEDQARLAGIGVPYLLGGQTDLETISRNLFAGLRYLDSQNVDLILAHDFGDSGLGVALWDRLHRAAEGNIIYL
jgi:L-threonylcarbamoyladenylate synthase